MRFVLIVLRHLGLRTPVAAPAQDAANGEKVFAQCRAHQVGENAKNAVGLILNGLIGRHSGSVEGYDYSPANKNSGTGTRRRSASTAIRRPRSSAPR